MTAPYTEALGATIRVKSQADRRRTMIYRDQHGRKWSTEIDTDTMHPCVAMTPAGWRAPMPMLVPAQKYLTFTPGDFGAVTIDYDQWLIDATDANREYRDHLLETAKHHFNAGAAAAIEGRNARLLQLAGPGPAAVDFVRAMRAGNKWALGLLKPDGSRYPMPPWAEPIVDTLRRIETYGGSDVDLSAFDGEFPDVEDDDAPVAVAARMDDAADYLDLEDAVDPFAARVVEPIKRGRGRPRKTLTD